MVERIKARYRPTYPVVDVDGACDRICASVRELDVARQPVVRYARVRVRRGEPDVFWLAPGLTPLECLDPGTSRGPDATVSSFE